MKIKALVTTLVLGSSSLAFADHATPAPIVRDHRPAQALPAPLHAKPLTGAAQLEAGYGFRWHRPARPVLLANDTHLTGRAFIQIPTTTRAFTKLELRSNNGRTNIDRVLIVFGNGQRQVVKLGSIVNGKKSVTIDLPGGSRNVKSVMLIGNSLRRATIDVLAV